VSFWETFVYQILMEPELLTSPRGKEVEEKEVEEEEGLLAYIDKTGKTYKVGILAQALAFCWGLKDLSFFSSSL